MCLGKFARKSRNSCRMNGESVGAHGHLTRGSNGKSPGTKYKRSKIIFFVTSIAITDVNFCKELSQLPAQSLIWSPGSLAVTQMSRGAPRQIHQQQQHVYILTHPLFLSDNETQVQNESRTTKRISSLIRFEAARRQTRAVENRIVWSGKWRIRECAPLFAPIRSSSALDMCAQSLGLFASCPCIHGRDTETLVNDSNSHHLWLTVNQIRSGRRERV